MQIDLPTVIGLLILLFQGYNQYVVMQMRIEVSELKVLIYRDFVAKEDRLLHKNRE